MYSTMLMLITHKENLQSIKNLILNSLARRKYLTAVRGTTVLHFLVHLQHNFTLHTLKAYDMWTKLKSGI